MSLASTINDLPDEILETVIECTDWRQGCRGVCRRWRKASDGSTQGLELRSTAPAPFCIDATFPNIKSISISLSEDEDGDASALLAQLQELSRLGDLSVSRGPVGNLTSLSLLTSLHTLTLASCDISEFPVSICEMSSLKRLALGGNKLETLPEAAVGHRLASLEYLDVSSNRLSALPSTLSALTALTQLDIQDNKIVELPAGLEALQQLAMLNASINK